MSIELLSIPELNRRTFEVLCREIGPGETLRFLGQFGLGSGNYTRERRGLFADLKIEDSVRAAESEIEAGNVTSDPTQLGQEDLIEIQPGLKRRTSRCYCKRGGWPADRLGSPGRACIGPLRGRELDTGRLRRRRPPSARRASERRRPGSSPGSPSSTAVAATDPA